MTKISERFINVTSRTYGATTEICVEGEIDIASVSSLSEPLDRALDGPWARIVVDLAGVTFLETQCVHLLADSAVRARSNGASFVVVPPAGPAMHALDLVGFSFGRGRTAPSRRFASDEHLDGRIRLDTRRRSEGDRVRR